MAFAEAQHELQEDACVLRVLLRLADALGCVCTAPRPGTGWWCKSSAAGAASYARIFLATPIADLCLTTLATCRRVTSACGSEGLGGARELACLLPVLRCTYGS